MYRYMQGEPKTGPFLKFITSVYEFDTQFAFPLRHITVMTEIGDLCIERSGLYLQEASCLKHI